MKLINILKFIFKTIGILFLIIILGLALLLKQMKDETTITKAKDYDKALEKIENKQDIQHFPTSIPKKAKRVRLYAYKSYLSNEILLLNLEIEKSYIEQELKKYTFINADTPIGTPQKLYNSFGYDDYTFYALKNESNEYFYKNYFPYFNGIAVDKTMNNILYYYILPD